MNSSGRRLVQANNAGHLGRGTLVVRVRGAYSVRVPISVVGFSVLEISANLYPSTEPVNQVTTLKRVARSDGSFQLAVLALSVVLSDNTTFDVSAMNTTSYHVVQNDAGVVATLGPKPRNLLVVSRGSDHGTLTVYGEFAGRPSRRLDLVVSSEVVTIQKVLSARVDGLVDQTLIGLAGSAHAQIEVRLLMSDGSQLLVRNFSAYSGLVDVEVDRTEVVRLDVDTGRVVLLRDYHAAVHITVSASSNATGRATVAFFCNTEPAVGGVDIGQRSGPPMPKLAAHDRVEIPLRVNAGSTKLLAFDLKITYDPNKAKFLAVADDTPYHHEPGVILLANVIPPDAVDSGSICSLLFESVQPGVLELQASVNSLLDEKLDYIGARDPRTTPGSCSQGPPGDVNRDCVFDIKDAALTLLYSLDIEREGRGNANHKLFPDVTSRVVGLHYSYFALHWRFKCRYVKCESRLALDCVEEVVLGKLKCQVVRPFTRDGKNPDSSGPTRVKFFLSLVKGREIWHFSLPNTTSSFQMWPWENARLRSWQCSVIISCRYTMWPKKINVRSAVEICKIPEHLRRGSNPQSSA